jgi:SagB-type dehydrogenase family enzyme
MIYLVWERELCRYLPDSHSLERVRVWDDRVTLWVACLKQDAVSAAPAVIIVAANYGKIRRRYKGRGERYAILEAGHVGQNIHLQAQQLGLGCVMIGAFKNGRVKEVLGIEEDPLYVIPVGRV